MNQLFSFLFAGLFRVKQNDFVLLKFYYYVSGYVVIDRKNPRIMKSKYKYH